MSIIPSRLSNNHNLDLFVVDDGRLFLLQSNGSLRSSGSVSSGEMERQAEEEEELGGDHGKNEGSVGSRGRIGHHFGRDFDGEEVGRGELGRRGRRRSVGAGVLADEEGFDGSERVVEVSTEATEERRRAMLVSTVLAVSVVVVRSVVGSVRAVVGRVGSVVRVVSSRVTWGRGVVLVGTVVLRSVFERDVLDSDRLDIHPVGEFVLCSEHLLGGEFIVELLDRERSYAVVALGSLFGGELTKSGISSLAGSRRISSTWI